jgi:CRISPR-associated protein Csd1
MILQALKEYYLKKDLPPQGFEKRQLPFLIIISPKGRFLNLEKTEEGGVARQFLVPKDRHITGKNAYKIANILWDHYGYVLGKPKDIEKKSVEMANRQLVSFISVVNEIHKYYPDSIPLQAVFNFYKLDEWKKVPLDPLWGECSQRKGCNLGFRVDGVGVATDSFEIGEFVRTNITNSKGEDGTDIEKEKDQSVLGMCMISGGRGLIARKHTPTPINKSRSNAKLVSFQKNSGYDSYGKSQGTNAPISVESEAAYTTALKHLVAKKSSNVVLIGTETIVFWSDGIRSATSYDLESNFSAFFADPPKDDPDRGVLAVKALYEAVYSGTIPIDEGNRFYVLGLAPNAARIAVRFWKTGTIRDFAEKIKKHFDDMEIVRGPKDKEYLTLNQMLKATAFDYKMANVPPNLAGAIVESVLDGTPYPITLMHQCIRRVRAERKVTRIRAAILKACINRTRQQNNPYGKEEITVPLDRSNTSPGYRLGRLFAVLEKIQEEANPGINATIRDRFYGAASSSPVVVFPQLLKLKNHHLTKLTSQGRKVNFEKELGEIFDGIEVSMKCFPAHLSMEDQACFAVGYYHQKQSFFRKA